MLFAHCYTLWTVLKGGSRKIVAQQTRSMAQIENLASHKGPLQLPYTFALSIKCGGNGWGLLLVCVIDVGNGRLPYLL